ncbi:hypothetical protein [Actinoplanes sp. NPDC026619]|uniref:hypothetical protein n=1 Tax=Actinoplanes sp. NPDC026619 TaxID=3155798 RepID=UPI0033E149BA
MNSDGWPGRGDAAKTARSDAARSDAARAADARRSASLGEGLWAGTSGGSGWSDGVPFTHVSSMAVGQDGA